MTDSSWFCWRPPNEIPRGREILLRPTLGETNTTLAQRKGTVKLSGWMERNAGYGVQLCAMSCRAQGPVQGMVVTVLQHSNDTVISLTRWCSPAGK
jgi:hypothetical protein